jgi:hypothetical protein
LEKLHVTKRGSVAITEVELDDDLDQRFKPGLYRQNAAFLGGEDADLLVTLDQAIDLIGLADRMGGHDA